MLYRSHISHLYPIRDCERAFSPESQGGFPLPFLYSQRPNKLQAETPRVDRVAECCHNQRSSPCASWPTSPKQRLRSPKLRVLNAV